jgi:predicted Rossmann fold nucleotide-binding protein DprA/Smf involved in DNA uptake
VLTWEDVVDALPRPWRDDILAAERERAAAAQPSLAAVADVSDNERLVLKHLATDAPRHVDAVAARSRLEPGALADALVGLELKGLAAALPGGFYVRRL